MTENFALEAELIARATELIPLIQMMEERDGWHRLVSAIDAMSEDDCRCLLAITIGIQSTRFPQ